jgi:SAM-dependent methyltransferase
MMMCCPQCGHEARLAFRAIDLNHNISEDLFPYYRCPNCGLVFLRPIPIDLGRYYALGYYPIPTTREELAVKAQGELFKLDMIRPFAAKGRLLEIGSSYGSFAYAASQAGYEVDVIEMSEQCCEFLRRTAGIHAVQSDDPANAMRNMGPYDVITMWHVIEHLPDPWSVIEIAAQRLLPGGILAIGAPNPQSLQFKVFGKSWMHLDAPRHLQLIPLGCLRSRLERCGLTAVETVTTDQQALACNFAGWITSMVHLSQKRIARACLVRIARRVQPLAAFIERYGLNSSAYTLICRRDLSGNLEEQGRHG